MKIIELSRGHTTIIDDEDFEHVTRYKWHANPKTYKNGFVYVRAAARIWHKEEKRYYNWTLANWIMRPPKGLVVDHIDGNPLNNQRSNLRICTQAQNIFNKIPSNKNRSSKYRGVSWDKSRDRWVVHVGRKFIGRYVDEDVAARAYNEAVVKVYDLAHKWSNNINLT